MLISYAQNFEDILLHRAFADVSLGFYIDVGACSPDSDSVTRHFYQRGWSGINIEPSKKFFRDLTARRPRDINLNLAIGRENHDIDFYEVPDSGFSSLGKDVLVRATNHGLNSNTYKIQVEPLSFICQRYCQDREISFLKIDVEGYELEVIASANWSDFRPVVVLVEAIHPDTHQPTHLEWEHLLTSNNYQFVWFDGLNRFYIRNESIHLKKYFMAPPNITDGFFLSRNSSMVMTPLRSVRNIAQRVLAPRIFNYLVGVRKAIHRISRF